MTKTQFEAQARAFVAETLRATTGTTPPAKKVEKATAEIVRNFRGLVVESGKSRPRGKPA